jgi:hypothetical protein
MFVAVNSWRKCSPALLSKMMRRVIRVLHT